MLMSNSVEIRCEEFHEYKEGMIGFTSCYFCKSSQLPRAILNEIFLAVYSKGVYGSYEVRSSNKRHVNLLAVHIVKNSLRSFLDFLLFLLSPKYEKIDVYTDTSAFSI